MAETTFYIVRAFDEDPYDGALVEQAPLMCSSPDDVEWVATRLLRAGAVGAVGYLAQFADEGGRGPPHVVFRRGHLPDEWS